MFPPISAKLLTLVILLSFLIITTNSTPYSSIAISHTNNSTLVCALIPSSSDQHTLNCTSLQTLKQKNYPSGSTYYSAIAAGNGFLCALSLTSNVSTMRWWEFKNTSTTQESNGWGWKPEEKESKRVYAGPPILALSAGDTHVCAIQNGTLRSPYCWRWRELNFPPNLNFSAIAVGRDFLCGLPTDPVGKVACFGNDTEVVNGVPSQTFVKLAAGTSHACGVSEDGLLSCWGSGAPVIYGEVSEIRSLALGENTTCVLLSNWTAKCWGKDWVLPERLNGTLFLAIEAKGSTVCGVLSMNYSLVCWGSTYLNTSPVYDRVLPGACVPESSCPCDYLQGSGSLCGDDGVICQPCAVAKIENIPTLNNSTGTGSSSNRKRLIFIVLGSVGAGIGILAAVCFIVIYFGLSKRRKISDSRRRTNDILAPGVPHRQRRGPHLEREQELFSTFVEEFPLSVIVGITSNFSESHKIGSGSFGTVYRATLEDGRIVAIKRACTALVASTSNSGTAAAKRRRDKEVAFLSELALLSRVNHKNLVCLTGYCREGAERILIYEFMANGSLHDHLHKLKDSHLGSWGARLRVALDAARGIEYLHTYAVPPIIHRDIKSANILLDDMWTAKVSDFGLSLMSSNEEDGNDSDRSGFIRNAAGTVGYMDPEGYRLQNLTAKSDVYSFGVVLLELLTGCKAIHRYEESGTPRNVVEFAVQHIIVDNVYRILDPNLPPPMPGEIEAVTYVSYLAADCVSPEGRDRPTMTEVVSGLERAITAYGVTRVASLQRSSTIKSI